MSYFHYFSLPSNTESIKSFLTLPSCLMGLFVGILSNGIVLGMIATFWIKSFLPPSIIITDGKDFSLIAQSKYN